jgi:hypothetical protein
MFEGFVSKLERTAELDGTARIIAWFTPSIGSGGRRLHDPRPSSATVVLHVQTWGGSNDEPA